MRLPDPLRDHIYYLVIFEGIPHTVPAVWLTTQDLLIVPDSCYFDNLDGVVIPTLEVKGQDWLDGPGCGSFHIEDFCIITGFAQQLHELASNCCKVSDRFLELSRRALGTGATHSTNAIKWRARVCEPECKF